MIWLVPFAFLSGCGVLILMRDEIRSGYYRWTDYLLVTPLLYVAALALYWLSELLPAVDGAWWALLLPIKLLLGFALFVVVWGGTLTAGALIVHLLMPSGKPSR